MALSTVRYYVMGPTVSVGCLLLLWLHSCLAVGGAIWNRDTLFDNKLPAALTVLRELTSVPSLGTCAMACKLQNGCQGFFCCRNATCKTVSARYLYQGDELTTPGYQYYRLFSNASCPPGSALYEPTMTCYTVFNVSPTTWTVAQDSCRDQGGRLAVLDTTSKMDFFLNYFKNGSVVNSNQLYFLGALRPYPQWNTYYPVGAADHAWLSGVTVNWTLFHSAGYTLSSEPNNQATNENVVIVYRYGPDLKVGDSNPQYSSCYVCEFSVI